ncbi:fatty acid desaturase-domain-containing protein [Cristinia sonorae]|uniref:Fatty acid desaturase-domain-containing protein n=1 Tax=Cristinia sonorae TaxID=1940300 RepID=A0A8K0UK74_9AGAR|nr:fatty acid desaturase-domain-containing protein [Cristinia sonorae]
MTKPKTYEERLAHPFESPVIKFSEIQAAVPAHLRTRSFAWAMLYVIRCSTFSWMFYVLATRIDSSGILNAVPGLRWAAWAAYWFWQSVAWAGIFTLAHEAGHDNVSDYKALNYSVGYILHSFLLAPHFSWRATHNAHHKYTNSIEKDENWVPRTREMYNLPPEEKASEMDYEDLFGDTPIYTLGRLIAQQVLGWPAYLIDNTLGNPVYPRWTNHFSPYSPLFKPKERSLIAISDVGVFIMAVILYRWTQEVGAAAFMKLYLIPWLLSNHWLVMLTFLHHSDPSIPHYETGEWTWLRGSLATVDRPLLGWVGRVFLHNVSHDHVAHHLFPHIPFYNLPKVTEAIKPVLKDDYNYDNTNTFVALWRSFKSCVFVDRSSDGIVFYKDGKGKTHRSVKSPSKDGSVPSVTTKSE